MDINNKDYMTLILLTVFLWYIVFFIFMMFIRDPLIEFLMYIYLIQMEAFHNREFADNHELPDRDDLEEHVPPIARFFIIG